MPNVSEAQREIHSVAGDLRTAGLAGQYSCRHNTSHLFRQLTPGYVVVHARTGAAIKDLYHSQQFAGETDSIGAPCGIFLFVLRWALLSLFLLLCSASVSAQGRKTVFVITDAEGVAGVCRQEQTDPTDAEMRQLLTAEINCAVEGFYAGGADEVIVWDGHGGSQTLSALTIHPRAKLVIGRLPINLTLDRHYSAVAFVGQHAHANRKGGVMAHSYSSLGIQTMLMNGNPVGEIETRAALAGAFNTPVIFLSGDQAAADDLRAIVPNAEVAVVKEGLSNYVCISLSARAADDLIREGAKNAMKKVGSINPYVVSGPVTIQIERTARSVAGADIVLSPDASAMDARTVLYRGKTFLEAWTQAQRP